MLSLLAWLRGAMMGLGALVPAPVKRWGAYILLGLLAILWIRRDAVREDKLKDELDAYKEADRIRRRVRDNLDDRLRRYDDAGWRDE